MCSWWKKKDKEIHHGQSTISDEVLRDTQQKFNAYDANGNGTIDRDELAGLLRALDLVKFVPDMEDLVDDDSYKIVIHTGAHKEAGTDSKVSLTLYGESGDSGSRMLTTARNATFERGQISTLRITSSELGNLTKVKIGHDSSGTPEGTPGKGWYLDKVVVSKKGMEPVTFGADRWLCPDHEGAPDKETTVTLTPGMPVKKKTEKKMQKEDKVMYVNPVYGPGGNIEATDLSDKVDPLGNPNRRITIISANGLINADMFDKSDPYCVIYWNGKRVGKTSTIDNTTEPRWDEDFTIQMPESGEGLLRCELYDHDMFGGDDPLGTVEFKLGGASNPRALLQTADYAFPDEKFTGFLTLRVDHAASRFTGEDQHEFKDKWMKGMTYREHREKHVFEEWTRLYIMVTSGVLSLFALIMLIAAMGLADCEAGNSSYLSTMYLSLAPFMLLSCIFGFYGAFRVKGDVEAETMSSTGSDTQADEDDGLQTTGQRILEAYNMLCVLIFVTTTVIIAETWVLEDEEAAADIECPDAKGTLDNLMIMGFISLLLLCGLIWCCTKIVSFFEILQSLAEFLAAFLMVTGVLLTIASAFVVNRTICLDANPDDGWPAEAYMFVTLGIFGVSTVAISFLGFAAAYQESMKNLLLHAIALMGLAVFGFVTIAYIGSTSVTEFITGDNCHAMLTTVSESFLQETFGATKYYGRGMSLNATGMWEPVNGPPTESPSCFPKTLTAYYWEDPEKDVAGHPTLYGCMNENGGGVGVSEACVHVAMKMSAYDTTIFVLTFWLMFMIIGSIASSVYLRKETSMVGHVLIHPHAKAIFWIMKITLLGFCIFAPFLFTDNDCGVTHDIGQDKGNLESSLVALPANTTYAPASSCTDGSMNGDETDVDCGGSACDPCDRGQGCFVAGDCCPDPANCDITCVLHDPMTPSCLNRACIPGQVAFLTQADGKVGICDVEDTCDNGQFDGDETGIDCGGPCPVGCSTGGLCDTQDDCGGDLLCSTVCFSCNNNALDAGSDETDADCGGSNCGACADEKACLTGADCLSSLCYNSVCSSYSNGIKDADETDVDCGGSSGRGCQIGLECALPADCVSGFCPDPAVGSLRVCSASDWSDASCSNGIKDYAETCIDGGGYQCRNLGAANLCKGPTCTNVPDQGTQCPAAGDTFNDSTTWNWQDPNDPNVAVGQRRSWCLRSEDCETGFICSQNATDTAATYGSCFSCSDGVVSGDEIWIDCGGAFCDACGDNSRCHSDGDCLSSQCIKADLSSGWGVCASRYNRHIDGGETGRDCGGLAVLDGAFCGMGDGCNVDNDCATANCDATAFPADTTVACMVAIADETTCEAAGSCAFKAGTPNTCVHVFYSLYDVNSTLTPETGAVTTIVYAPNEPTTVINGVCSSNSPVDSCANGQLDGDESDMDCGGLCAGQGFTCADASVAADGTAVPAQSCNSDLDCNSGSCGTTGVCVSCSNGVQDGDESDVDCGGSCNQCGDVWPALRCTYKGDCVSDMCGGTAGATVCASCTNQYLDGDETGIDCGGSCPTACPLQQCTSTGQACGFTAGISGMGAMCLLAQQVARAAQLGLTQPYCLPVSCRAHEDCQSGFCNPSTLQCSQRSPDQLCADGVETDTAMHGESDVDCGGTCALTGNLCASGLRCDSLSDCASGVCVAAAVAEGCTPVPGTAAEGAAATTCTLTAADGAATVAVVGSCAVAAGSGTCNYVAPNPSVKTCGGACDNGVNDGGETGTDCGGECGPCDNGSPCAGARDCTSGVCYDVDADGMGECTSCFDSVLSPDEAGIDCGPACDRQCSLDSGCLVDSDCISGMCTADANTVLTCTAPAPDAGTDCADSAQGSAESGVDCGGECQQLYGLQCADGAGCFGDLDCRSGTCIWDEAAGAGTCVSCSDQVLNGFESDVDCGGSGCSPCIAAFQTANTCSQTQDCEVGYICADAAVGQPAGTPTFCTRPGQSCNIDSDCGSGDCSNLRSVSQGQCVSCSDNARNGLETDVDCGGQCAAKCAESGSCSIDGDCASGYCRRQSRADRGGVCAALDQNVLDLCANGASDPFEPGVDCGGDCVLSGRVCELGDSCWYDGDCRSGTCDVLGSGACAVNGDCQTGSCVNLVCVPPVGTLGTCVSCTDNIKNGDETGTDCGGFVCGACSDYSVCLTGADCVSGQCTASATGGSSTCTSCSNTILDGTETGIDCGGGECTRRCPTAGACAADSDCQTGSCVSSVCAITDPAATCIDTVPSGTETATDCGGAECVALGYQCSDGLACLADTDCANTCDNGNGGSLVCVSCADGIRNGAESDIDCGGDVCSLCQPASGCTDPMDPRNPGVLVSACTGGTAAQSCNTDQDCTHDCFGATASSAGVCVSSTNGVRDGTEGGVDCGFTAPFLCSIDTDCAANSDCSTGTCGDAVPASCSDSTLTDQPTCEVASCAAAATVVTTNTALCTLSASVDFGATAGTCADVDATATCAPVVGTYAITLDSCTSTLVAPPNTVTTTDTTGCTLSASADFGTTPGNCIDADATVATCAYVAGTWTITTADTCTSTEVVAPSACVWTRTIPRVCVNIVVDPAVVCRNGNFDGTETDTDCGGEFCRGVGRTCSVALPNAANPTAAPRAAQMCVVGADCASGTCSLSQTGLTCNADTDCSQGYGMSDTKCYIPAPRIGYCTGDFANCDDGNPCDTTGAAGTDTDTTNVCNVYAGTCVGTCTSCNDHRQNGAETDVDCGGGPSSCNSCNVAQTCSCGAATAGGASAGRCGGQQDCSAGMLCYASFPDAGLPASGITRINALGAAQDAAVCMRPASIGLNTVAGPLTVPPGSSLISKVAVSGESPSGVARACIVTARIAATGNVALSLPNYQARIALDQACRSTTVSPVAGGITEIVGPYGCVDLVLSEMRLDTTCTSIWTVDPNGDPALDQVTSIITTQLTATDAACDISAADGSKQLTVNLLGRPQLTVKGVVINANCVDADSCTGVRANLAIVGVNVQGTLESCPGDAAGAAAVSACSAVAHPQGLAGGCCDIAAPYNPPTGAVSCAQVDNYAYFSCASHIPGMLDMPRDCPQFCGLCPPVPPPPPALSTTTGSDVTLNSLSAVSSGSFMLRVPLGVSGATSGNVELLLTKTGWKDTKVVLAVQNGVVDVGHVVMVEDSTVVLANAEPSTISGSCIDLYNTDEDRTAFATATAAGTGFAATLYEGHIVTPAVEPPSDIVNSGTGNGYQFSSVPAGTYTVVCSLGNIKSERYVFSKGEAMPVVFDAVALPAASNDASGARIAGGVLDGGAIMVSASWQVMGDRSSPIDIDLNGKFPATATDNCHVFFSTPECGDMTMLRDYRPDIGTPPVPCPDDDTCPILDGPTSYTLDSGTVTTVPSEAILISTVRGAIYTFYVQYNNPLLFSGVDAAANQGDDVLSVVEVSADIFAGDARIAHTVGRFEAPGTQPYLRLFCIDATSGSPTAIPQLLASETPPSNCVTCPC